MPCMWHPSTCPGRVAGDDAAFEAQLCRLQAARQLLTPASLRLLLAACDRPAAEAAEAAEEGDGQRQVGNALGGSGGSGGSDSRGEHRHRATLVACPDGVCASCSTRLAALPLTAVQRRQMCDELLSVAAAQGEAARQDLLRFGEWVVQQGFTHIVDGPNVGYRNQNFPSGSFSFAQVDLACRKLHEAHGRPPLLVMPAEYLSEATVPNHTSSNPANLAREQEVTPAERAYMRAWRTGGVVGLWACPEGTSDDWYWMYATVVVGAEARVLSNDEMRDHAFRMLAPSYFARWRARHLVRFDFSHGASHDRPEPMLTLTEPPAFSVEIQQSSRSWHLPSSPHAIEWLCLTLRPEPVAGIKGDDAHDVDGKLTEPAVKRARGDAPRAR